MEFFRAHQATGTTIPTYFIESTAPHNVDDTAEAKPKLPPELSPINSDLAVKTQQPWWTGPTPTWW
jgi:hypothetical protein